MKRNRNYIILPNNCKCSQLTINSKGKDWYIGYRFYDPSEKKPLQILIRGMNGYKDLTVRKAACKRVIEYELQNLRSGFNPIKKRFINNNPLEIEKDTFFFTACEMALNKLSCSKQTISDIKSVFIYVNKAAILLGYNMLSIGEIKRKHISMILDKCREIKPNWSAHRYNHYRSYLQIVFKKLVELEAMDFNPVDNNLPKMHIITRVRKLPKDEDVIKILEHLKMFPLFYRFFQIFFHSGARPIELLRLKIEDVDLQRETFILTLKKGNRIKEDERPIKNISLQYWKELINEAKPNDYLFGTPDLKPNTTPITRDFITKFWHRQIIKKLNIPVNLYTFKHKNLDEIAAYLSINEAQRMAGHGSKAITMQYAVHERERVNNKVKEVPNVLGG